MKPVGLTMKKGRNKYRLDARGELMLVHQCVDCGNLSINRVAADDDAATIVAIFQESLLGTVQNVCERLGIAVLNAYDSDALCRQLYGSVSPTPVR
jgi:hypothetical protein